MGAISQSLVALTLVLSACGPSKSPAGTPPAASAATVTDGAATPPSAHSAEASHTNAAHDPNAASMAKSDRHAAIHQVLRSKRKVYRECFNVAHAAHPELEFAVVTFAIDLKPSGEVEAIKRVEGTPSEQVDMVDCMTAAIRSLTFPPHPKGRETTVRYPLEYNSK